jgi:uncharacterized protein
MTNSLQEQLLKLGLVSKSKAQQAKKARRKERQQERQPGSGRESVVQAVARVEAEKAARDRGLNRQKELKQEAKARKALLRQFIEQHRLNDPKADQPYNFVHGSAVKRLYVTAAQRDQLVAGRLAIVHSAERYFLVGPEAAGRIRDMSADTFVFMAQQEQRVAQQEQRAEQDPYAGFQVPDDLMW